jgi:cell division protein FtsN
VELNKYIKEILIDRDNVIVAGFGAFEKSFNSAKIDPVTQEMYPPQVTIIFNPELKEDSGVLLKYVSEKENISEENASELIKNQVVEWEAALQSEQGLELVTLGNLSKNPNGEYLFVPVIQASDFPESYGLPIISVQEKSATVPPVIKKEEEKKIVEKKAPIQKNSVQPVKKHEPAVVKKSNKKLIVGLVIGLPIVALIVLGALNFGFVKQKFNDVSNYVGSLSKDDDSTNLANPVIVDDSLKVTDSTARETEAILENYTIVNAETNSRVEPKMDELAILKKVYIIAGSYKVKEHATRQRNKLNKKGFTAEVLPVNNGYYRVSVASFDDIKSAANDFDRLKGIDESLDVWILINK